MALEHERSGSGRPLVLVHGLGSSMRVWDAPLPLLAAEREVIAIDLPGFGQSPMLNHRPSPEALADAVEATIAELGLDRPAIAGNSLGGLISLELARRGCVSSAVALSPAGFAIDGEARFAAWSLTAARAAGRPIKPLLPALTRSTAGRALLAGQLVGKPSAVPPEQLQRALSDFFDCAGFEATRDELFAWTWPHREELPVPATVAWAEKDRLLLPRQALRAAAWIPGIRLITMPGTGHVPCWDDPPLVARTILEGIAG